MKKCLLVLVVAITITKSICAQFNYTFSAFTDTYTPLVNGTNITDSLKWTSDTSFSINTGFSFELNGFKVDSLFLQSTVFVATELNKGLLTGFTISQATYHDRGNPINTWPASSPVRYLVEGLPGNRICKLEYFNMGFGNEFQFYGTNNDSANVQIWIYEGTNIVEIRFGSSNINHAADYFFPSGEPFVTFTRKWNFNTGVPEMMYYLTGDFPNPTIDSTNDPAKVIGLSSYPDEGTVYRFTPKSLTISATNKSNTLIQLKSNSCNNELFVKNQSDENVPFKIISINGSTIFFEGVLSTGSNNINVSKLSSGVYLFSIATRHSEKSLRFIKL